MFSFSNPTKTVKEKKQKKSMNRRMFWFPKPPGWLQPQELKILYKPRLQNCSFLFSLFLFIFFSCFLPFSCACSFSFTFSCSCSFPFLFLFIPFSLSFSPFLVFPFRACRAFKNEPSRLGEGQNELILKVWQVQDEKFGPGSPPELSFLLFYFSFINESLHLVFLFISSSFPFSFPFLFISFSFYSITANQKRALWCASPLLIFLLPCEARRAKQSTRQKENK